MNGTSFWDANPLIYWLEKPEAWTDRIQALRHWHLENDLAIVTSSLTLAEILVHPVSHQHLDLARDYKRLISEMGCYDFGVEEAWRFAEIRSAYPGLKPPDCIQLACASTRQVDYFFTNDEQLHSLNISGVGQIRCLSDSNVLD